MTSPPGVLFIVATPIGNLEDLTFRALRILKEVDLIAAEDTRRTSKLLAHYDIRKPLVSVREHNESRETPRLLARLARGERIALVSDAGTPGIADPGARLVTAARAHGIVVSPIPGASAVAAALSVSGLIDSRFIFAGFPPAVGATRRRWFEELGRATLTTVCFEAPHRIHRTLEDAETVLAERPIFVFREMTKLNESLVVWDKSKGVESVPERGEFVLVIPGLGESPDTKNLLPAEALEFANKMVISGLFDQKETAAVVSQLHDVSSNAVRKHLKRQAFAAKQRE